MAKKPGTQNKRRSPNRLFSRGEALEFPFYIVDGKAYDLTDWIPKCVSTHRYPSSPATAADARLVVAQASGWRALVLVVQRPRHFGGGARLPP